ncbi:thioesterase family protein [Streptomyces sp. NPDC047070]|uniref:thioesterase family protein n=1 Tax=Streptomyces sp. NPDC047070 TaxID=3154923 RepID=UPI0034544201
MSTAPVPSFDQVMELPAWVDTTVSADFIDENGHMNIRHYLELDALSTTLLCEEIGIDDGYRTERRMGVFTAEHHLRYFSEMHEGEKLSVHVRVLARSSRAVHMMTFLLDRTHGRLANTLELLLVHVDMDARRAVPLPDDIAAGFDRFLSEDGHLAWQAPVCGVMGVRS